MVKCAENKKTTKLDQRGVASIFVVLILMTLLGLISVGFSRLMNQEVRRSLDRQLSVTSYYAAESGVNSAKDYLASGTATANTKCDPPSDNNFVAGGNITGDGVVKYSCVLIDPSPKQLFFSLKVGESKIYQINQSSLDNLYFSWENNDTGGSHSQLGGTGSLPQENSGLISSDKAGILRVAIYPVPSGNTSNAALTGVSKNYFMYPSDGPNGPGVAGANGSFVDGKCGSVANLPNPAIKRYCNTVVKGLLTSGNSYFVRITAMYKPAQGEIEATNHANNLLSVTGQSTIDVTGTSSAVSQRIRTIVDTSQEFNNPVNALWSMNTICKLFRVPVSAQSVFDQAVTDTGNDPSGDNACQNATPTGSGPVSGPIIPCMQGPGCPPTCGGDNCGGGGGGGGGGCSTPPGCPPTCGGSTCPTKVRTIPACLLDGAVLDWSGRSAGLCTGGGGAYGQGCLWSDGNITWGAC